MKIHYCRKTDMIYQDQHIHYMQVVCNFPVKIKFWREIFLAMTFAYICYVGDPCVTFFNRSIKFRKFTFVHVAGDDPTFVP